MTAEQWFSTLVLRDHLVLRVLDVPPSSKNLKHAGQGGSLRTKEENQCSRVPSVALVTLGCADHLRVDGCRDDRLGQVLQVSTETVAQHR